MELDVFVVGNALVDIQAKVSDETLQSIGFPKGIMTLVDVDVQQRVLSAIDSLPTFRCAGGSTANSAIAIAQLGGRSGYAGKVGQDPIGDFFLEDIEGLGIASNVNRSDKSTGTSVILITDDAQRTMLTHLGACQTLEEDDLDEALIRASKYVYVEGYLFSVPSSRRAALRTMELAKSNGVKVAFTVSDPFLINDFRDEFLELIEGPVDLLFCNEQEAKSLTNKSDSVDCAHELHRHAENVALTLGAKGSLIMHNGDLIPIEGVEVENIDTTGAGDMYAGGVLYGITNGLSWKQAGHVGSAAAARIVSQLGARLKTPLTPEDIRRLAD